MDGMWIRSSALAAVRLVFHAAFDLAVGFGFGDGVSLIIEFLTAAEAEFDFDAGAFEVNRKGHEGIALLADESRQFHDLPLMHEQAALPQGLTVEDVPMLVGADVDADGEQFTVFDMAVGILEVDPPRTDALDFGAAEFDPGFVLFIDKIVVVGFLVLGDHLSR